MQEGIASKTRKRRKKAAFIGARKVRREIRKIHRTRRHGFEEEEE